MVIRLPASSPATHNVMVTQSNAVSWCADVYGAPAILAGAENRSIPVAPCAEPTTARQTTIVAATTRNHTPWRRTAACDPGVCISILRSPSRRRTSGVRYVAGTGRQLLIVSVLTTDVPPDGVKLSW